jgi:hypothetical protein
MKGAADQAKGAKDQRQRLPEGRPPGIRGMGGDMPIRWCIDHSAQRVAATLPEDTSEGEMYDFLGELVAQGAMPYAKVFDASAGVPAATPSRIGPIAATARLYARMGLGPVGPTAIVVGTGAANMRAELLADAAGRVRLFGRHDEAEAWLGSLPRADET